MIRKILESTLGSMTDTEFIETIDLANTDIVTNRVGFRRRTSLSDVVEIAEICFKTLQRGKWRKENFVDNNTGECKVTDRDQWFVKEKERGGITYMHSFAVGVITAIIDDRYRTAEEMVREIRGTLSDLEKVWSDGTILDGYRHEKALRANGEHRVD